MINLFLLQATQGTNSLSLSLAIPILTALLTTGTTFGTMLVKDIFVQNKKDRALFLKERLESCYTPLYLKMRTRADFSVGFLRDEINDLILSKGHLLNIALLEKYSEIYDLEKVALSSYDHTQKIISDINQFREEINTLDRKTKSYNQNYEMYDQRIKDYLELAKKSDDVYRQKEEKYIDEVKALRENIEDEYKELVVQYYRYYKTETKKYE